LCLLELFLRDDNLLGIPASQNAQDNAHCFLANLHISTGLRRYRQQKERKQSMTLTSTALGKHP